MTMSLIQSSLEQVTSMISGLRVEIFLFFLAVAINMAMSKTWVPGNIKLGKLGKSKVKSAGKVASSSPRSTAASTCSAETAGKISPNQQNSKDKAVQQPSKDDVSDASVADADRQPLRSEEDDGASSTAKRLGWIRSALHAGQLDEAERLSKGVPACASGQARALWNAALDTLVKAQRTNQVEAFVRQMVAANLMDVVSYNTVIKSHLQQTNYARAWTIMGEMRKAGCTPNTVTYNEMIHALVTSPKPHIRSQVWATIDEMKSDRAHPNRITCSILLKSLGNNSPHAQVLRVLELTSAMDEAMDEVLLCSVLEACVRTGQVGLTAQKLEELRTNADLKLTNVRSFGSLIKAYGFVKDVVSAWRCWQQLRSLHLKLTSVTIGCMVETVVSNGDVDGGHELISSLLEDPTCKDQVNAIIYGSVLKGYRNSRRMERVLQVFDEMLANGIAPIQTTYNVVIDACTRAGQADRVPGLVVDMRSRGMEPNLITYSTIIKGFCQGGNMKAALATLNDMRSNGRLKPDEILYNTLLDGCAQAGLVVEGEQLLKEMLAEELAPSSFTMTCMFKLLGQAGRIDRAFELMDFMSAKHGLTVNAQSGSLLIQACLSANDLDRAMSAHERLAAVQVQPETRTCQALVRGLIGADEHVRAIKLLRGLLAVHVNLGDQFLSEVLATLRATEGESKALAAVLLADVKKAADGMCSDRSFDDSRRRNAGMSGISGPGSCRQHRNNKVMCR